MLKVASSPNIKANLESAIKFLISKDRDNEAKQLEAALGQTTLSLSDLKLLHSALTSAGSNIKLKELLNESKLSFESVKKQPTEPSPELIRRRQILHARQEARMYNQMVYGKHTTPHDDEITRMASTFSSTSNQMAVGGNMIAAIFATFGIAYYACMQLKYDKNKSVMVAVLSASAIMVVEMVLFIIRAFKVDKLTDLKTKKTNIN